MARYDESKAIWERRKARRQAEMDDGAKPPSERHEWHSSGWVEIDDIETGVGGGDWLIERPELPQDAVSFLKTLRVLGYHLQDQRYRDLHGELLMSDLIDRKSGKWRHFNVNPESRSLFEQIENVIASGVSEREAIAQAIVEFDITGHGFEGTTGDCHSPRRSRGCSRLKSAR